MQGTWIHPLVEELRAHMPWATEPPPQLEKPIHCNEDPPKQKKKKKFTLKNKKEKWKRVKSFSKIPNKICIYCFFQMEKAMAPHSSTLAWKIPWTEEPGALQSMGSLKVGHDWAASLSLFTFMHWRRKWQPTLVFLPGESQGWGSLVGCHLWGCTESDTTEMT